MDLRLSEEQGMLRDTARRLCADLMPTSMVRTLEGTDPGYSPELWARLSELGITGLAMPPEYGGTGLGSLETAIVHEQLGAHLATCPHWISSVLAARLIERGGSEAQRARWLPGMAEGTAIVTVASLEADAGHALEGVRCEARLESGVYRLSGTKTFVPFASACDALIVLARTGPGPAGVSGFLLDPRSPQLRIAYQPNHAKEPCFRLDLEDVVVPADQALCGGGSIATLWQDSMYAALAPLAAQSVGGAASLLDMTVEYAKSRKAFGKPIGAFQAIAHYLADVKVEVEGCRLLVLQAAWALDAGQPYRKRSAIAKAQADETFRRAAAVAIQVHGGLGYTNEADPQLYFRRAKQWQLLNWSGEYLQERIAELALGEVADA